MTTDELAEQLARLQDVEVQIEGGDVLLLSGIALVVDAQNVIVAINGPERDTPEARVASVRWSEIAWIKGRPSL